MYICIELKNKSFLALIKIFNMDIGKKIAALRKTNKMSQTELAKALSTSDVGRYERDEMTTPSNDAARKIAKILNTTVGYLPSETEQEDLFKRP